MEMEPKQTWTPILHGDAAAPVWQAIDAVVETLTTLEAREESGEFAKWGHELALLLGYLAKARSDDALLERADAALSRVLEAPEQSFRARIGLYGGAAGLAMSIEQFNSLFAAEQPDEVAESSEEDDEASIDEVLCHALSEAPPHGVYDLIGGIVGVGVYLLERLPRPGVRTALSHAVERLAQDAEWRGSSCTWLTPPNLLPAWQRALAPAGYYNLGLAHGVPGIIYFLGELIAQDVATDKAERLWRGAVEWVLAQRNGSALPGWLARDQQPDAPSEQLAWCYGELGAATVVHASATRLGVSAPAATAREMLLECAERPLARSRVRDAGLCHGAAGNAHIFNRLYQRTSEPAFLKAAVRWFDVTLSYRKPGEGIGGFLAHQLNPETKAPELIAKTSFLEGGTGIALALLAAVSSVEPAWDRRLALSGLPRR